MKTVLHVTLQAVADAKTLLTPFLPRSSQAVHEMLGGTGDWSGMPRIEQVDEDGGPSYPVITGDYDSTFRWESRPVAPGTPLAVPTPLFTKLDQSVVDEEIARLGSECLPPDTDGQCIPGAETRTKNSMTKPNGGLFHPATAGASEARLPEPGGFDAHTHMDIVGLPVDGVLAAAAAAGINRVVNVGCDLASSRWAVSAAAEYPDVYAAVAIHPNETGAVYREREPVLAAITALADVAEGRGDRRDRPRLLPGLLGRARYSRRGSARTSSSRGGPARR